MIAAQYHLPVHTAPGLVTGYERLGSFDCSPVPPSCSHSSWVSDWLRAPSTTSLVAQLLGSIVTGYESPVPPPCSHSSWVSDWLREAQYHLPGHTTPGFYSDCMGTRAKYTSLFTQLLGSSNWYNNLSRAQ